MKNIFTYSHKTNSKENTTNYTPNYHILIFGLNIFFVFLNMSTFYFGPSKKILNLLVPIKYLITTFGPYFEVKFCIF